MKQMDEPLAKLHLQANKNYLLENKSNKNCFFRYIYMYL